ncbi:MAG TPA: hypothetical protein HA224_03300 [Nanoarchaeota archaeon]|nr:hypothetical protein [Nanoarchaeota archaeon]
MSKQKVSIRKTKRAITAAEKKLFRQTFNLKFRDDAAQYFALVDYLQQNKIKFKVTDSEHLRVIQCDEKFAQMVQSFVNNDELVQFARDYAHTQASGFMRLA